MAENNRIVICFEERHVGRVVQVTLERQGYDVTRCYDRHEALDLVKKVQPMLLAIGPYEETIEEFRNLKGDDLRVKNTKLFILRAKPVAPIDPPDWPFGGPHPIPGW